MAVSEDKRQLKAKNTHPVWILATPLASCLKFKF